MSLLGPHHRRFLRYSYRGRHRQFWVLLFSPSFFPRGFIELVKAALAPQQSSGMKVLPRLDNWLTDPCTISCSADQRDLHTASSSQLGEVYPSSLSESDIYRGVFGQDLGKNTSCLCRPGVQGPSTSTGDGSNLQCPRHTCN